MDAKKYLATNERPIMTEDFPDFLRIPQDERRAAWRGRKLTRQGSAFRDKPTKVEEAATRQLRKELEAAEAAKKEARFARLKELAAERKAARKPGRA